MKRDFNALARRASAEYHRQAGIISVSIEGDPAVGLRYSFRDLESAERFMALRRVHNSYEPDNANTLRRDACEVIEIWP
jgi:hypothetical protein